MWHNSRGHNDAMKKNCYVAWLAGRTWFELLLIETGPTQSSPVSFRNRPEMHMTERGIHSATCSTPETEAYLAPKAIFLLRAQCLGALIKHRGKEQQLPAQLRHGSVLPVINPGTYPGCPAGKTMSSPADHMQSV